MSYGKDIRRTISFIFQRVPNLSHSRATTFPCRFYIVVTFSINITRLVPSKMSTYPPEPTN